MKPAVKSAALLCAALVLLGFLPLLGGFRYEAALAAGLLAPSWAACAAFLEARRRSASVVSAPTVVDWAGWALPLGVWHAAAIVTAATLHDLVRGTCEFLPGLALVLLGPAVGACLGAAFGAAMGTLVHAFLPMRARRRRLWVLLGPLGPLATATFALGEFYFGPGIYAYDPFAGYFGGPLYDTIPFDLDRLSIFRLGSALSLLAFTFAGRALVRKDDRHKGLALRAGGALWAALAFAGLSLAHSLLAPTLGLATTTASLAEALPGAFRSGVCIVRASPWVSPRVARRVAWECEGHVRALRQHFDLPGPGAPITVYLFATAEEKGRLMGARTTYLAKPWRREVYVQVDAFPHPVLGHELAHAVTADFGSGPFRVAGPWGGLIPDPGRIEGFAVAASPTEEGDATEAEWAKALLDLGQLPPSRSLFSLGFLGSVAVKSYTSAGAFVAHLHRTLGPSLMKRWYRGEDLEALSGRSWAELDREYRQALQGEVVSTRVRALAEEMFSRPSLFGRSCPHAADRALGEALAFCPVNADAAERAVARALALDPTRRDAEGLLPGCYLGAGDTKTAARLAHALMGSSAVSGREKVRALVISADLAWASGHLAEARAGYDEALEGALTGSEVRSVSLKRWALDRPEPTSSAVRVWLAAGTPASHDLPMRLTALSEWYAQGTDRGISSYLLGLQLIDADPARGGLLLEAALESGALAPAFVVEADRRLLIAACLEGDRALQASVSARLSSQTVAPVQARRAARLRARCEVSPPP